MPAKLYKYRPFSVRALRALTEAEIYYAKPNSFNDPLDCDPTIEVDIGRASLEKLLFKMRSRRYERDEAAERIGYLRYMSTEYGDYRSEPKVEAYLSRMLATEIKDELDDELGNAGVVSLSETWKSALMWSHYADEHRGICIEYDTTEQAQPRLAPVNYKAPRAVSTTDLWAWKMRDDPAAREQVMQTYYYAKSAEWKYEREWRDVREKSGSASVPYRMTAVHFGMRCDVSVITTVVKLLTDHPEIKLWQIWPKDESFKLRRRAVPRDEIEAVGVREPAFLMFKDLVFPTNDEEQPPEVQGGEDVPPGQGGP